MNKDNNTVVLNIEVTGCCSEEEIAAVIKRELDKMTANAKPKFPKWEELEDIEAYRITGASGARGNFVVETNLEKDSWPTRELAQAQLAMSQLAHFRDYVNDGWEPNWTDTITAKECITIREGKIRRDYWMATQHFLTFKNAETRDGFLEAYRDLIEIAKPLL